MTEICFVIAPRQNRFFVEVAEALQLELAGLGMHSEISRDGFPPFRDGLVYALIPPHEYRGLAHPSQWPTRRQLQRTIFYCFEQPGTSFFENDIEMSKGPVGAVLDLNAMSVDEFRRHGVTAHHAPVGWTPAWSHEAAGDDPPQREIDLLHLGTFSPRRGEILARSAHLLSRWRAMLVLGDDHGPNPDPQENFTVGHDKWGLLARSRVLLNIHLGERRYFEWLRVVQAICNGTFVVSEHSTATAPLRPGEHFASARPETLVLLAERYLEDEGLRARSAADVLAFLRDELPLSATAALIAELADDIDCRAAVPARGPAARAPADADALVDWPDNSAWRDLPSSTPPESNGAVREPAPDPGGPAPAHPSSLRAQVAQRTTAFRAAAPRVSVLTGLSTDDAEARRNLDSAVASRGIDVELIVVADGPDDEPLAFAGDWLRAHDDVAALLLRHPVDHGPGWAWCPALDFARGELILLLDPGEALFPSAATRLMATLDETPQASFAWGMARRLSRGEAAPRLVGAFPWQPWRLADGADGGSAGRTALWRVRDLRALRSGVADVPRGDRDPSLVYRLAALGGMRGEHLPEILTTGFEEPVVPNSIPVR